MDLLRPRLDLRRARPARLRRLPAPPGRPLLDRRARADRHPADRAPRARPGAPDRQLPGRRGLREGRGHPPGPGPDADPDLPGPARPAARRDLLRFPMMSLPWVGAWLLRHVPAPAAGTPGGRRHHHLLQRPRAVPAGPVRRRGRRAAPAATPSTTPPPRWWAAPGRSPPSSSGRPPSAWRDAARDHRARPGHLRQPTTAWSTPRMAGRAAHAFAERARIVVLPHTGHVAHMEHPGLVAAEIGVLAGHAAGCGNSRLAPAG